MTFESRVRGERVRKFPHGKTPKKERRKQNKKNRLREKERTTRLDKVRQEAEESGRVVNRLDLLTSSFLRMPSGAPKILPWCLSGVLDVTVKGFLLYGIDSRQFIIFYFLPFFWRILCILHATKESDLLTKGGLKALATHWNSKNKHYFSSY